MAVGRPTVLAYKRRHAITAIRRCFFRTGGKSKSASCHRQLTAMILTATSQPFPDFYLYAEVYRHIRTISLSHRTRIYFLRELLLFLRSYLYVVVVVVVRELREGMISVCLLMLKPAAPAVDENNSVTGPNSNFVYRRKFVTTNIRVFRLFRKEQSRRQGFAVPALLESRTLDCKDQGWTKKCAFEESVMLWILHFGL